MGTLRQTIYARQKLKNFTQWRFDTIGDVPTDSAFVIRRVTDNVEQTFTYAQITDGTYDAFVSGTFGAVKNWYNGTYDLSKIPAANQMYLLSNSGKPYMYNPTVITGLSSFGIVSKFSNDWIVSIIHGKELNGNNQRVNLAISGDKSFENFTMIATSADNRAYIKLNVPNGGANNTDLSVPITTVDKLDVYTYAKIGGVLTIRKNNTILAQGAGSSTWTVLFPSASVLNGVFLGSRDDVGGSGKLNKYQHIGHIANTSLSSFDLTGYINSLMT